MKKYQTKGASFAFVKIIRRRSGEGKEKMAQLDCFHYSCVLCTTYLPLLTIYYILQTRFASTLQLLRETQRSHTKVQGCNYDRSGKPFTSSLKKREDTYSDFAFREREKIFYVLTKCQGMYSVSSVFCHSSKVCYNLPRKLVFILRLFGSQIAVCSKASAEYVI